MTPKQREEIYDKEVAPLLLQAGKICEEHEIPFIAVVFVIGILFGKLL